MVKHIVAFKLTGTDEERREVALKFKEALLALPEQIDVLRSMEVGINENPNETWDVVLTAVVDTMADVEVYAKHPAHVAAAGLLAGHKDQLLYFDLCIVLKAGYFCAGCCRLRPHKSAVPAVDPAGRSEICLGSGRDAC
jgi:hypothetical protein